MPPRRPPAAPPNPYPLLRARGALLGLAVGDALGSTLKGRRLLAPSFPHPATGIHRTMRGGGPFALKPGQVGESGQMACCLALGLRESGGYDVGAQLRRYLKWRDHAVGMDAYTQEVFGEMFESQMPKLDAAQRLWLKDGRKRALNGSLARTAPLGVFFHKDAPTRALASFADSMLTHFDPRCQLACATLNASIACAINAGEKLTKEELYKTTLRDLAVMSAQLGRTIPHFVQEVASATADVKEDLSVSSQNDPLLYWPELHMHHKLDHVRVAFRLAYWELEHAPSFEVGLVDVVNRGGDSDMNGAVAGALLGAFHGVEAIPHEWRRMVLEALNLRAGPLWTLYHPRDLLLLAPG
jgi:ADP-ribosyl-[dinitrogen reductase] hydrolase